MKIMAPWDFGLWLRRAKEGQSCIYAANVMGFAFLDAEEGTEEARVRDLSAMAAARGEVFLWQRMRTQAGLRPVYDYIAKRSSLRAQIFVDKVAGNAKPIPRSLKEILADCGKNRDFGDEGN